MRNQKLERTLQLLRTLQRGRRTLEQLGAELGVTTRTVRRDLEVLSASGFPVVARKSDYGDVKVWHLRHDGRCPVCERV